MNHFTFSISKDRWLQCNNQIPSDYFKTWKEAAESTGLHGEPCHTFGHPQGFHIGVHTLQLDREFAPNPAITEVIILTLGSRLKYYYCPGTEACLDKLEQLTGISGTELLTQEWKYVDRKRNAIVVEEVEPETKPEE